MKKFFCLTLVVFSMVYGDDCHFSPILASRNPLVNKIVDVSLMRQVVYVLKNNGALTQCESEIFSQNMIKHPLGLSLTVLAGTTAIVGGFTCLYKTLKHLIFAFGYSAGTVFEVGKNGFKVISRREMETHAAYYGKQALSNSGSSVKWAACLAGCIALGILPVSIVYTYVQTA